MTPARVASRRCVLVPTAGGYYVQPTVTFVYPPDRQVSEDTPLGEVLPILRSALVAEQQTERFARAGGRGVVLRLGLLDGPGTWFDDGRLRRHAARLRCRARAARGVVAAQRHLQRLP